MEAKLKLNQKSIVLYKTGSVDVKTSNIRIFNSIDCRASETEFKHVSLSPSMLQHPPVNMQRCWPYSSHWVHALTAVMLVGAIRAVCGIVAMPRSRNALSGRANKFMLWTTALRGRCVSQNLVVTSLVEEWVFTTYC